MNGRFPYCTANDRESPSGKIITFQLKDTPQSNPVYKFQNNYSLLLEEIFTLMVGSIRGRREIELRKQQYSK